MVKAMASAKIGHKMISEMLAGDGLQDCDVALSKPCHSSIFHPFHSRTGENSAKKISIFHNWIPAF